MLPGRPRRQLERLDPATLALELANQRVHVECGRRSSRFRREKRKLILRVPPLPVQLRQETFTGAFRGVEQLVNVDGNTFVNGEDDRILQDTAMHVRPY